MEYYERGLEDIERTPVLSEGGAAFDTTDLTEITIKVFHSVTLRVLDTYTFTGGDVEKVAPNADGQIRFVVPATVTADAKLGKYFYQIQTTEADETFPSGVRLRSYIGWCFGLKNSV